MKPISILILSDAGPAGRELLARRDVELSWALSPDEARAVLERRRPRVVLTREEFTLSFLKDNKALLDRVPVVVLLDGDGWERRDQYFSAGATALVSSTSLPRILEAVTELTGLPTRYAPRVPYPEVVDVSFSGTKLYLEAMEIGASGISIRDFPPARVGDRVEIGLVMMDPPHVLSGMVVRAHVGRSGAFTEVAFNGLDEAERAYLDAFVDQERARSAAFPEPVGLSSDIVGGTFTLDLFNAFGDAQDTGRWVDLLRQRIESDDEVRVPKWLLRVARDLTAIERQAIVGGDVPAFALAAVEMRVDLARAQAALVDAVALRESCELGLDFCRSLAVDARDCAPPFLAQVPEIRAGILTQIYGWTMTEQPRASDRAA